MSSDQNTLTDQWGNAITSTDNGDGTTTYTRTIDEMQITDPNSTPTTQVVAAFNSMMPAADAPEVTSPNALQVVAMAAITFGTNLFPQIQAMVWAINEGGETPPTQQQILTLLSDSTTLQQCLESGSLVTAMAVINELVSAMPQYQSVGTWAIGQINTFLGNNPYLGNGES